MTNTTNYNLKKPEDNDNVLIGDLNENADAIDQALHGLEESKAAKAKPAKAGSLAALDESGNLTDSGRTPGAAGGVATLDEGGKVPEAQLPEMDYDPAGSADAVQQALNSHTSNKQNPHGVTAKQAGADPAGTASSSVSSHNQDEEAHPALQAKLNSVSMAVKATYPVAAGQTITAGDVVDVVDGKVVGGKKSASAFEVGDIVRINENGSPVNYIIVNQGKPSGIYDDSCDGTWLLRQDLIEERVWDSLNANKLENSTIQSWLNNDMLKKYDSNIQNAIKQAKIPYRKYGGSGGSDQTGANGLSCKVFIPSGYEVGWTTGSHSFFPVDGAKLSYFESGTGSSANNKRIAKLNSSANHWYTRSPTTASASDVWRVDASGAYGTVNANNSSGIRPAFILNGSAKLNDDSVIGQAIALQDGSSGQSIEIIYSGTVAADWVTEGQVIDSDGVYGVGVLDGVLQVWSKARPADGLKYAVVEYTGTKQTETGSSAAKTIEVGFYPIAFFISVDSSGGYNNIGYTAYAVRQGRGSSAGQSGNGLLQVDWTDTGFTLYALSNSTGSSGADSSAINSMNSIGKKYHCLVLGV